MQGRLSKPINGKIQSFPKDSWENEFYLAKDIGFKLIEWVLVGFIFTVIALVILMLSDL